MRIYFVVASKAYGLIQAYSCILYILTILPMMRMLTAEPQGDDLGATMHTKFYGESLILNGVSITAVILITFIVSWICIFRAEWLADKLQIPAIDNSAPFPSERLLNTGTKLIGLSLLVQGMPSFTSSLIEYRQMMLFGTQTIALLLPSLLRIIIGLILVMKTDAILNLMTKKN